MTPPPPRDSLDRKLAVCGCLCVSLASLFFSYAAVLHLGIKWGGEESVVEVLTAACLLLAGILLFAVAKMEKARLPRCAYLLGGLAMAFACGEELSWGQHLFGFATPDFLTGLNTKQEFNFHNLAGYSSRLRYALSVAPSLAAIVVLAAFLCHKEKIFGVALPSLPLMLSSLLAAYPEFLFRNKGWPTPSVALLLLLFFFALFSKQVRHCVFTAALLTVPAATLYASHRCNWYAWHPSGERLECLLALVCLFYAAELWWAKGGRSAASWRPLRRLAAASKAPVRRLPPPWLLVSALMAAGSSGLAVSAHLASKAAADAFASDFRKIMAAEPSARSGFDVHVRSEFDVHLMEDSLIYFKEPCSRRDLLGKPFFVHVHPADPHDLPEHRVIHGFDNLDFDALPNRTLMSEEKCIVKRKLRLPKNRAGARIITGQYSYGENRTFWEAEFPLSQ